MPELLDHVAYLSQEIGPRPAGTEEEQQAALYITEQMQKEAGLSAAIEDFGGAPNSDAPRVLCCILALVVAALSLFLPVLGIASIAITAITALLFAAEAFDHPVLSKAFARGVSQNVVAKYEPGFSTEAGGSRRRKVILVAHYDSGKVRAELNGPLLKLLPVLQWAELVAMVLLPVLLVVRNIVFANDTGMAVTVMNVLVVIALVPLAIVLIFALVHKLAAYNEAANCNAAGTAVLLETARRVGRGRVSEADLAEREAALIHGEEAARAEGLVPEGAQIVYEAASMVPPEPAPQTPEARLAAAKAAVAALSGKPMPNVYSSDLAENLVQVKEPPIAKPSGDDFRELRDETREALTSIPPDTMQAALANAEAAHQEDAISSASDISQSTVIQSSRAEEPSVGVPDWFKKAQEKAKKPRNEDKPVQRSRYASALDAAVSESAGHFAEANEVVEKRLEQVLESDAGVIREVKAPRWAATAEPQEPTREDASQPSGRPPTAPVSQDSVDASASQPPVDPAATTAMAPIDVNDLRLDDMPDAGAVPMPSFLDPQKVQEESRAQFMDGPRTDKRVDVTGVPIDASGRITPLDVPSADGDENIGTPAEHGRRPIELPDIGMAAANPTPISELPKQRAPLADVEGSAKTAAKSLLTMLPSINLGGSGAPDGDVPEAGGAAPGESTKKPALRSMLPSLSGAIRVKDDDTSPKNVSAAGSFAPAGATGAFAPIGDELLDNVDPDDIYVDDADDSAYDDNITERERTPVPVTWRCPSRASNGFSGASARKKRRSSRARRNGSTSMRRSMRALQVPNAAAGKVSATRMRMCTKKTHSIARLDSSKTILIQTTPTTTIRMIAGRGTAARSRQRVWSNMAQERTSSTDWTVRTRMVGMKKILKSLMSSGRCTSSAIRISTPRYGSSHSVPSCLKMLVCGHSWMSISRICAVRSSLILTRSARVICA